MTALDVAALGVALVIMMVGFLGSVLPGIPGPPLILAAAVVHKLVRGDAGASGWVIAVLTLMTGLSLALDFIATSIGAKKMGATWRGAVGAALGALFGLLWMPFGLVLGPLLGAMALEMLGGREWREAGKAGIGAVLGLVAGAIGKLGCSAAMIGLFLGNLLLRWIH
jgi:hypothetical protein